MVLKNNILLDRPQSLGDTQALVAGEYNTPEALVHGQVIKEHARV
jgi:hypothetical protein